MDKKIGESNFSSDESVFIGTQTNVRCNKCGEEYEQPLFAKVISGQSVEEYYACPKCLSKVKHAKREEPVEVEPIAPDEPDEPVEPAEPAEEEQPEEPRYVVNKLPDTPQATGGCPHQLGYLKKRDKNSPFPEDCLVCSKMIECMS